MRLPHGLSVHGKAGRNADLNSNEEKEEMDSDIKLTPERLLQCEEALTVWYEKKGMEQDEIPAKVEQQIRISFGQQW